MPPEQCERLWQHLLHEDTLFNERLNSFVAFQSVLLGIAAFSLTQSQKPLVFVGWAGLMVSLISVYVLGRMAFLSNLFLAGNINARGGAQSVP
jgi:hypothetical protein